MASQLDLEQLADVLALMAAALRSQAQPATGGRQKPPPGDGAPKPALRTSANEERPQMIINAARFVTVELCSVITGLTKGAIGKRIERGYWIEGRQFRRAADGRIWIDMQAVEKWVQGMP